jgi:hypothetical protein
MMKLVVAVKRGKMAFHAIHGDIHNTESVDSLLAEPEVARLVASCIRHGDSLQVLEWVEDDNKPHKLLKTVC